MNILDIKNKLFGWKEADFSEYEKTYSSFGGNLATHPTVLKFIHEKHNINEKYFIYEDSSKKHKAAICVWDDKYLANDPSHPLSDTISIVIPNDELVIPSSENFRFLLPLKSKYISPLNNNIINSTFKFNAKRSLCLAKKLTEKSNKKYKQRMNNFIRSGGELIDVEQFSAKELTEFYSLLVEKRWGKFSLDKVAICEFIQLIKPMIFGNVIFFKKKPSAFHFITKTQFHEHTNVEFIQAGMDCSNELSKFSIGSLLIWSNIYKSENEFKNVRFSFGRPSRNYKLRWSNIHQIGRTITLI
ncbi:GNAT family N-acetyltransferase [Xenorhabdus lircayensis]|uniref:GNAT family N-acetyltransferase n=1 Tax=Xenorhabdus lircayensis TaxID=2763499 RepID=A0ABS0U169_9GAMM|nr:GNAT family N-acetyltransferase [Xenorhabdus lircayensis]MBI6547624.1 GNAT family N-acetyltransferase [Xenorhabdus lircayensis]